MWEPFRECRRHFLQTLARSTPENGTTLGHRGLHLIAAASLPVPLVNHIVYIALRYFVRPPSIQKSSFPEKPTNASSRLAAAGSFDAAVKKAQNAVATVQNEGIKVAISDYVEFIEKSARKLIAIQDADEIIQLIYESVADELENIASQIKEISFESFLDITEIPEALAWQKFIWHALQSFDHKEVERLIRSGKEKKFLNQPFDSWFGATFFIHIAKMDRYTGYFFLAQGMQCRSKLAGNVWEYGPDRGMC
jgi:hypothetical protein